MRRFLIALTVLGLIVSSHPDATAADPVSAQQITQIASWLSDTTYSPAPTIAARAFWNKVAEAPDFTDTVATAQQAAKTPFRSLPDDLYLEYSKTGNRTHYQDIFFAKLAKLRALVVAECIENRGRFLPQIEQAVTSYAADKTWVLPAHDGNLDNFYGRQITVDLFASEVASDLATLDHMLGDRLGKTARSRIRQEVQRRIFSPYKEMVTVGKPRLWWLTGTNNWNAVCLANVTSTALALIEERDERAFYIAAAAKYIQSYYRGFTDDGYCSEGIGYWNYGYGCFVRLAHILDGVTDGHVDLFAAPKARAAGLFARRVEITPGTYPAFADCTVGTAPDPLIMSYVSRRYQLPATSHELDRTPSCRFLDQFGVYRFAFETPVRDGATPAPELRDWFDKAGILISRGATTPGGLPVGIALKGGHNAEHHNHNDVGSYVYCIGNAMPLVDPGAEVYTRRTFSSKRYDSDVLNSFGHPVPLIGGKRQRAGRNAMGKVVDRQFSQQRDSIQFDIRSAYDIAGLSKLTRSFEFDRPTATLTVTDAVTLDAPTTFGTALITNGTWQQRNANQLEIGSGDRAVLVDIDTGGAAFSVTAVPIDEDVRGGKKPTRLGIDLKAPVRTAIIRLRVRPAR